MHFHIDSTVSLYIRSKLNVSVFLNVRLDLGAVIDTLAKPRTIAEMLPSKPRVSCICTIQYDIVVKFNTVHRSLLHIVLVLLTVILRPAFSAFAYITQLHVNSLLAF